MAAAEIKPGTAPSSSPRVGIKGVRLILADTKIGGGQRVMTFSEKPLSLDEVSRLLVSHLGFSDLCVLRGFSHGDFAGNNANSLIVTGFDGPKRVPIQDDVGLVTFLSGIEITPIPSIEVRLPQKLAATAPSQEGAHGGGRMAKDRVEQLEDANFKLLRATDKIVRRIEEVERQVSANKEEARRNIMVAQKEIQSSQDNVVAQFNERVAELRVKDESILADLDVVRKHARAVEKQDNEHHEEMQTMLNRFREEMEEQMKEVDEQIEDLRRVDDMLQQEDMRQQGKLDEHLAELTRLASVKVEIEDWEKQEKEMTDRITVETTNLHQRTSDLQEDMNIQIAEARRVQKQDHKALGDIVNQHRQKDDEEQARIERKFDDGLVVASVNLTKVKEELLKDTETKVKALSDKTEAHFDAVKQEMANKDSMCNNRIDDLIKKCETTFKAIDERLTEMVRVERARFGQIEKDLVETTTKLRADCRMEVERVRADYEKEASRLDADLGDIHMKHDTTKQELTFVQSKIIELREWAQRQLTETATATRAVQVDSQEGLSAATKMLHALRDDAIHFREKMAKYVSMLQHTSDSQGDAITALEGHRGKIRGDLDAIIADHTVYTVDMDGWADDVRMKVERLFKAMEPARVEWKICRAHKRSKDMKRPLGIKSPPFSLRALREVQMEFFPDGTNSTPEGKALLRVYLPSDAQVRYQTWVGFSTEGPKEIRIGGNLAADVVVDEWKNQLQDDGSLPIALEVLRDLANEDASLAREVRVESP